MQPTQRKGSEQNIDSIGSSLDPDIDDEVTTQPLKLPTSSRNHYGEREEVSRSLPLIKQKTQRSSHPSSVRDPKLPSFMTKLQSLISYILEEMDGDEQESQYRPPDTLALIKRNEKLRSRIRRVNEGLNLVIDKKKLEVRRWANSSIEQRRKAKRRKDPNQQKLILLKLADNNEKTLKNLQREEMRLDVSVRKIRDLNYLKNIEEDIEASEQMIEQAKLDIKSSRKFSGRQSAELVRFSRNSLQIRKKRARIEETLFLAQRLQKQNEGLRLGIQDLQERKDRSDEVSALIENEKESLVAEAKGLHVIKSPEEREYHKLREELSKVKRGFALTAKNFEMETRVVEETLEKLRSNNNGKVGEIQQREEQLDEMIDQREAEMQKLKQLQEMRIKWMIQNLEKEIKNDQLEGRGPGLDSDGRGDSMLFSSGEEDRIDVEGRGERSISPTSRKDRYGIKVMDSYGKEKEGEAVRSQSSFGESIGDGEGEDSRRNKVVMKNAEVQAGFDHQDQIN